MTQVGTGIGHVMAAIVAVLAVAIPAAAVSLPPEPSIAGVVQPVADQIHAAYEEAASHPNDAATVGRVGQILHAYGLYDLAAPFYARARALAPREPRWTYLHALTQRVLGEYDAALASIRQFLSERPDDAPARAVLGDLLLATGQPEEARKIFVDLVARQPGSRPAHYDLGRALVALGQPVAAIAHLERAAAGPPEFAAARYALALAYRDTGRAEQAREQLAAYRRNPAAELPRADPAQAELLALDRGPTGHNRRALAFMAEGRLAEVAAELEAVARLDPTDETPHVYLIETYARLRRYDLAEREYRAALAIRPDSGRAHFSWGSLLLQSQRFADAAHALTLALKADPDDAPTHVRLGRALEGQGLRQDAATHYQRALEIDPLNREARYFVGQWLLSQGKTDEGLALLERTLSPVDAETPLYMRLYGLALARTGNRERAVVSLREARRLALELKQRELAAVLDADLRGLAGGSGAR